MEKNPYYDEFEEEDADQLTGGEEGSDDDFDPMMKEATEWINSIKCWQEVMIEIQQVLEGVGPREAIYSPRQTRRLGEMIKTCHAVNESLAVMRSFIGKHDESSVELLQLCEEMRADLSIDMGVGSERWKLGDPEWKG